MTAKLSSYSKYTEVITLLIALQILLNSQQIRQSIRSGSVQVVDSLFWTLHWYEGIAEYNSQQGYTSGNFVPVARELYGVEVNYTGRIPDELAGGMFTRMGANPTCWPPAGVHHAFNGEAMMHRIQMRDGFLEYSNSWIIDSKQTACTGPTCDPTFTFGDLNAGGFSLLRLLLVKLRSLLFGVKPPTQERLQAGSTNLVVLANKTYTVSEVVLPYEINLTENQVIPVGFSDLNGLLANQSMGPVEGPMSAHPKYDPMTGEMLFFAANFGQTSVPVVNFGRISASGENQQYLQIPVPSPAAAFYHDMWLTPNYAVFFHSSLKKDPSRLVKGKSLTFFDEQSVMKFGVLPRNATSANETIWIDGPTAGHIWHTSGAKEDGDILTLFAPKFDSYSDDIKIHLENEEPSYLKKFELNLTSLTCRETQLFSEVVERPTVNENVITATFAYLRSEGNASSVTGNKIVKFDMASGKAVGSIECASECKFGEPVFVPKDNASSEDDGYIMDIVYLPETESSQFMIWDAKTMEAQPVLSSHLPQRVPYGAHGKWLEQKYFH